MKKIIILAFILLTTFACAQPKKFAVRTIAFYNVENLFDTINDPNTLDDARTPEGADRWTSKCYNDHVQKIARVLSEIGNDVTHSAPDVIGLAEVENEAVVADLINTSYLKDYNYGVIHYDSPDNRGVDVALIYKKSAFKPISSFPHPLHVYKDDGTPLNTRDQLLVSGELDGEMVHFIVNHWPSRLGGEPRSRHLREEAAALNKQIIDSLLKIDPNAKVFSMGDFNDDPTNSSFKKILQTKDKKEDVQKGDLFNPMETMYNKGMGTLAHQDKWNLFDQIYFTYDVLKGDKSSYRYWKASVFNPDYLTTQTGRYKGYPFRSMANGNYTWGYSDHYPVCIYLIKKPKNKK